MCGGNVDKSEEVDIDKVDSNDDEEKLQAKVRENNARKGIS